MKCLFEDGYSKDTFSFTAKTKSNTGMAFEFEGKNKNDSLESAIKFSDSHKVHDLKLNFSGKLHNNGNSEVDVNTDLKDSGIHLSLNGQVSSVEPPKFESDEKDCKVFRDTIKGQIKYKNEHFHGSVSVTQKRFNKLGATLSGLGIYEGFAFGGDVSLYPTEKDALKNYNLALTYGKGDFKNFNSVTDKLNNIKVSMSQKINDDTTAGVEYGFDRSNSKSSFVAAVCHRVDSDLMVKAKVDQEFRVNVATVVRVNKNLKATTSVETSWKDMKAGSGSAKVAFGLAYEPSDK
jgi:hypothetical protein